MNKQQLIKMWNSCGDIERQEFQEKYDITYIPIIQEFGTWNRFKSVAEQEKKEESKESLLDY